MNYFDHAASSVIYPEVLDIINQSLKNDFANPSSKHILGYELNEHLDSMRADFLKSLGAKSTDHFIFTSSATEANNLVIKGIILNPEDSILYSKADHASVVAPVEFLQTTGAISTRDIILNLNGILDLDKLVSDLDESIKLVILTHVNSQSGVIAEVNHVAALIKKHCKAHVHVDAVQSFGKIQLKINGDVDSVSVSSHKIGGPKGVAGLYLKKGIDLTPLMHGGNQESGIRSGTVAYPLVKGFHKAMMISCKESTASFSRVKNLNEKIVAGIKSGIPSTQFIFENTSPYIISFILPTFPSDVVLRHLEIMKIFISSTSACSSKISAYNPSLMALHIPERFHKNFLRISLSPTTTEAEAENLISGLIEVWNSLGKLK